MGLNTRFRMGFSPRQKTLACIVAGAIGVIGVGTCAVTIAQHSDRDKYGVFVTGTERVTESDTDSEGRTEVSSKYVVFTKDAETGEQMAFENTDSFMECFFGGCKFDSSTIQAQLKDAEKSGKPVEIEAYGWRWPFFSMYKNIVKVNQIEID